MKTPDGWCSDAELEWLSHAATRREVIIELGTHKGRSTSALCSGGKVICCDIWRAHEGAYESFIGSFINEIQSGKVVPRRVNLYAIDDPDRVQLIEDYSGSADLVFIDAAHGKWHAISDISLARLLLKPRGLLCGHDLCDGWPGVREALDACAITYQREAGSIWREC